MEARGEGEEERGRGGDGEMGRGGEGEGGLYSITILVTIFRRRWSRPWSVGFCKSLQVTKPAPDIARRLIVIQKSSYNHQSLSVVW